MVATVSLAQHLSNQFNLFSGIRIHKIYVFEEAFFFLEATNATIIKNVSFSFFNGSHCWNTGFYHNHEAYQSNYP